MRVLTSSVAAAVLVFAMLAGCGSNLQPGGTGGSPGYAGEYATGGSGRGGMGGWGLGGAHVGTGGDLGTGGYTDTGGSYGVDAAAPGVGTPVCRSLAQAYAAALPEAAKCSAGATSACATLVPAGLPGDGCVDPCQVYVNDATILGSIQQSWMEAGCADLPVCILAIGCGPPPGGVCASIDGGAAGYCQYNVNASP